MKSISIYLVVGLISISLLCALTMDAVADRDDKPKKGNNGQCRKLQSSFPEEIQDYQGCHDTFTGKNKHDEEPLP